MLCIVGLAAPFLDCRNWALRAFLSGYGEEKQRFRHLRQSMASGFNAIVRAINSSVQSEELAREIAARKTF
jgi:hypothetical protein